MLRLLRLHVSYAMKAHAVQEIVSIGPKHSPNIIFMARYTHLLKRPRLFRYDLHYLFNSYCTEKGKLTVEK